MTKLSVEEILNAISDLTSEEREHFDEEYERRCWDQCLSDPRVTGMLKNRGEAAREDLRTHNAATVDDLRCELGFLSAQFVKVLI